MPTQKCVGILKNGSPCGYFSKGESNYCGRHQDQDPNPNPNRTTIPIIATTPRSRSSSIPASDLFASDNVGTVSQLFSKMDIGPETPIRSIETDYDDDEVDIEYSLTQIKSAVSSRSRTRRTTLSQATLLHVTETSSPADRINSNRRAKSHEPVTVTVTRRKDRPPSQKDQDQPLDEGLHAFLDTLSSPQGIAVTESLPKIFPDVLKERLWVETCKAPPRGDGTGTIYVFKTSNSRASIFSSPRGSPGNVVIKIGKTKDEVEKRGRQHEAKRECALTFDLLKSWPNVAYHGHVEELIMSTLFRKKYTKDCGAACTTKHREIFEVRERELEYVYAIIAEWVEWSKRTYGETGSY